MMIVALSTPGGNSYVPSNIKYYQYCEVFQAVTSSFFANTYRPRALFLANTSGRGPTKITAGRQLGLVQIRIALQEVCYVIDR